MVKIRLRRLGNKGRPFYRVVVAKSTAGRNGAFVEILGTYSAIEQPKRLEINAERALYWLREGAEPTRDGSAHAGTVQAGGESGDEGSGGGHGWRRLLDFRKGGGATEEKLNAEFC
ncbi:MAG: 30S ribosomal protein S16 [Verrucomicrobiaceae bacterium]|nr:MAG: 30S ribosomal protein S16 [Verrucomicrobiaceae bacterium]